MATPFFLDFDSVAQGLDRPLTARLLQSLKSVFLNLLYRGYFRGKSPSLGNLGLHLEVFFGQHRNPRL